MYSNGDACCQLFLTSLFGFAGTKAEISCPRIAGTVGKRRGPQTAAPAQRSAAQRSAAQRKRNLQFHFTHTHTHTPLLFTAAITITITTEAVFPSFLRPCFASLRMTPSLSFPSLPSFLSSCIVSQGGGKRRRRRRRNLYDLIRGVVQNTKERRLFGH